NIKLALTSMRSDREENQTGRSDHSMLLFVVDAKASVAQDNVAVSSPKTMEQSLGSAASRALPSAKPRSVFAFAWSVPGRTEDPATDSSLGAGKLDVSSEAPGVNKAPSDSAEVPPAAGWEEEAHKNLTQAPVAPSLHDIGLVASVTPEGEDAAASKPKQVTFFDRIFKLEKGKERSKAQIDTQEERQTSDLPDGHTTVKEAAGLQSTSNSVPQGKDSAGVNSLTAEQPQEAEGKQESPQTAAAVDNSIMSFLKTLVSFCLSFSSLGYSTEQQPVTSVKSDKNVPSSQEPQTTKQSTKAPEPAAQQQAVASDAPKEVTKERSSSAPMPLSKLFWKKVCLDFGTLNSTERPVAPAESEPVGQKSKESSKDKKSTVELSKQKGSKQETREQPDSREQQAAETDSIQNGGDASKEPSFKKTEKRQSLGGFFKGLVRVLDFIFLVGFQLI
uniref:Breast carcinoma amplified sequence 1 n=1 Tax=Amazona collaria TaxID=241587 RepID=A0A8B9G2W3_9PSIT